MPDATSMANKRSSAATKAAATPAAPVAAPAAGTANNGTVEAELLDAIRFSPPCLVVWGLGYLSDSLMATAIFLMITPLASAKIVDALGGPGAWNGVYVRFRQKVGQTMYLPLQIWIGPLMIV